MRIKLFSMMIIIILVFSINSNGAKLGSNSFESEPINLTSPNNLNKNTNLIENQNEISLSISPIIFTKNCGQLKSEIIKFYDQNNRIWFTNDGIWYELREKIKTEPGILSDPFSEPILQESVPYRRVIIKQEFVGANDVNPKGNKKLDSYSNFFYGNNSKNWKSNIPNYQEIYYANLYNGIDLCFYSNENGLKYDLIVHPRADMQQIRIKIKGANNLEINNLNNVVAKTSIGDLIDSDLYIYQLQKEEQYQIDGKFVLLNNFEYGFELLQDYQKNEPLIIDPGVRLEYSTYFGGSGADLGYNVVSDSIGDIYVTGLTYSSDFPTTTGALDTIFNGTGDAIVLKLNPSMSKLYFSTFIGGSGIEYSKDIAVDASNNIYLTGITGSQDFPTTKNAYDTSHNSNDDIFILKLNQNGSALIFSTFVGGSGHEWGLSINIDSLNNVFITGRTQSSNFPVTSGVANFGNFDVIIVKLNSTGSSLIYSRVFGGTNFDCGVDSVIDSAGNIYVTGYTQSNNFNITSGVYDPTWNGNYDAFILKLNKTGLSLDYSTYVGGSNADSGSGIDLDTNGNAVITGYTSGPNFPNTTGVFDPTYNAMADGFICKVDAKCSKLLFSTYISGSNQDYGNAIAVDSDGYIYVIGQTTSSDFTTTQDAFNKSYIGSTDIFFLKCDPSATQIIYSTFIGGTSTETPTGMYLDSSGQLYITGGTASTDFPISAGAINTSNNGGMDIFVVKFTTRAILNINSLAIFKDSLPVDIIYSKLCPYTFRIGITDTANFTDLKIVKLMVDPQNTNIQFLLNLSTRKFNKLNDPNDYILLESSSKVLNNIYWWTIDFNLTFNWTFPNEELIDVQIYATSKVLSPAWYNATNQFHVENDLVFNGSLAVEGDNNRKINEFDLIRGGEVLNWTGLIPVYENTTDLYPLEAEFDVTVWDEDGNFYLDSPASGVPFSAESIAPKKTYNTSYAYTINLSGVPEESDRSDEKFIIKLSRIPPESDKTNETFNVKIDADNVTFSNPTPSNTTWQTSLEVAAAINITDVGGGEVMGNSVMYTISTSNGDRWDDWKFISGLQSNISIKTQKYVTLKEGTNNLIKWKAFDSVGNGPNESEPYKIIIDTKLVTFSSHFPLATDVSTTENVEFGITISDATSGVDVSTIEYAISSDRGNTWSDWQNIPGLQGDYEVNIQVNYTFPNGTNNVVKWRASDIAGNGPLESQLYIIMVNTWIPIIKPRVLLINPFKGSIINKTSIKLTWMLENIDVIDATYDIYFGIATPIEIWEENVTNTSLYIDGLVDGEKYFWYVIPKSGDIKGTCSSGMWWFEIELPKEPIFFEIDISGPEYISLHQGENKSAELTIINLGNTRDKIKLELQEGNLSQYLSLDNYSLLDLESTSDGHRTLNFNIPMDAKPGIYQMIIIAISILSGEKDSHILTIEIVELEPIQPEPDGDGEIPNGTKKEKMDSMFWYLLIIVIIIILTILVVGIILKKRKKHIEPELLPGGSYAVKPGALPSPVITLDQVSSPTTASKLPVAPTILSPGQTLEKSIPTPTLAKSVQEPIQQLPQLPPAKIQDIKPEAEKTDEKTTSTTPIIAQPTISVQGPAVHLPDVPSASQKTPPIAKPVEPITSQTAPITQQIPKPTLAQPQVQPTLAEGPQVPIQVNGEKIPTLTAPGTTPEKVQSVKKKEEDNDS